MKTNAAGDRLIKLAEAKGGKPALQAYLCPSRIWTIGWGHTKGVYEGMTATVEQCEAWYIEDRAYFERIVERSLNRPANENQFSAMVALCFNIGEGWDPTRPKPKNAKEGFRQSTVLRLHNAGDPIGAAKAFAMWNKDRNDKGELVELKGLTRRRATAAALYMTPTAEEEAVDPQRTRGSTAEPAPIAPPPVSNATITTTALGGGGSLVAIQAVSQVSTIWSWLTENGIEPKIVLAVLGVALVGIGVGVVWKLLQARRVTG